MQIKRTNHVSKSFIEQESQLQAQPQPTTSPGIEQAKDFFEKPNLAARNPKIVKILDSMFPTCSVSKSAVDMLENALPPKETNVQPPPPDKKEPERASNSINDFKPGRS